MSFRQIKNKHEELVLEKAKFGAWKTWPSMHTWIPTRLRTCLPNHEVQVLPGIQNKDEELMKQARRDSTLPTGEYSI